MTRLIRLLLNLGDKWRDWHGRRGRLKDGLWRKRQSAARWEARHRR